MNEKMAAERRMATWGFMRRVNDCCNTPRKVSSSPMAGIKAMMNRLSNKPPTVFTFSIFSVVTLAASSKVLIHSSSPDKAPPRLMPSFHVVSVEVTGIETSITATPINISHQGGVSGRRPKSCIGCSLRVM